MTYTIIVLVRHFNIDLSKRTEQKLKKQYEGAIFTARNQIINPNARAALDKLKMETAGEVGVQLKQGYNGDLKSREAGQIGGNMVKKMIKAYEDSSAGNA